MKKIPEAIHRPFWVVANPEVILGQDLLAINLEICWEIPASRVKHRIAVRPSLVKSAPEELMG